MGSRRLRIAVPQVPGSPFEVVAVFGHKPAPPLSSLPLCDAVHPTGRSVRPFFMTLRRMPTANAEGLDRIGGRRRKKRPRVRRAFGQLRIGAGPLAHNNNYYRRLGIADSMSVARVLARRYSQ